MASCGETIIHAGSNDISKGIKPENIVENVDLTAKRLLEINPDITLVIRSE